ncbi:three-helix bundle dimerization domain-containing protein [Streptomyces sp. NPDC048751]|uniref:three-helix bundle dimerization domain-containing protein n=1 Tax=Streptomyces sp. NPDC048751 TaxID=3365591 RepID=UPI0037132370
MAIEPREEDAIRAVTERLKGTYTDTHTPDEVEAAVAAAHASFSDRRVRDFVPVLVERKARASLGKASD